MIQIGASTACFYPLETERALKRVGELGFSTAEVFFNSFSELRGPLLKAICREQEACKIQVVSVHPFSSGTEPFFLFSAYERRFHDTLEYYKRYFDAANALGAHLLVMHGLKPGASIEEPEYFERFGALVQLGRAQGIMVAQENVVQFSSQSPVFLARMRKALGNDFHMVLDLKQAVRSGLDRSSLRGNLPAKSSMSMSAITCPAGIACRLGKARFVLTRLPHCWRMRDTREAL